MKHSSTKKVLLFYYKEKNKYSQVSSTWKHHLSTSGREVSPRVWKLPLLKWLWWLRPEVHTASGFCLWDYPGGGRLKENKDHGDCILIVGRHLWHRHLLNQRLHLPLYVKNHQELLALDAPSSHPPNHDHLLTRFVWKSRTASSHQNAVLLSKPAKSLAGGGAAPVMSQERSAASEESKRNVVPGTLANSRKLVSI